MQIARFVKAQVRGVGGTCAVALAAAISVHAQGAVARHAVSAQAASADAHKQWMDDASDLQDDLRDSIRSKDGAATSTAALKIEDLMAKTEAYWAAKRAADIV